MDRIVFYEEVGGIEGWEGWVEGKMEVCVVCWVRMDKWGKVVSVRIGEVYVERSGVCVE